MASNVFDREILRTITHSWGRFIAILLIVALGVGFYSGLRMTAPDMKSSADSFYDSTNLMDIRVVSTLGLSEEDIDEFRDVEGVEVVQAAFETDVVADINGEPYTVRVHSLPDAAMDDGATYINELILEDGRLPSSPGECVMSADRIMATPLGIGDTVDVTECSTGIDDTLERTEYTVVGLVHSSYYASSTSMGSTVLGTGLVEQFMYVPEDDFDPDFPITEAYITITGAIDLDSSSQEYDDLIDAVASRIEALAPSIESSRTEEVREQAKESIADARVELERERADAYAALDDAKAQLDDAASTLEESASALDEGEREYADGIAKLQEGRNTAASSIADGQAQIDANSAQLAEAASTLSSSKAELDAGWAALEEQGIARSEASTVLSQLEALIATLPSDYPGYEGLVQLASSLRAMIAGQAEYDSGMAAYQQGMAQLAAAQQELDARARDAEATFASSEAQLRDARATLDDGLAQLESGRAQYEEGLAEYEANLADAERQFAEAESSIEEAERDLAELGDAELLVMDRSKLYGAESFDMDAGRVDSIAQVFPFVFFLVAALVALTTMTRMVDEERMQIGTYKALGYSRSRITSKYLIYAGAASLSGSILGILALSFTLPAFIMSAYSIMYIIPVGSLSVDIPIALAATGLGVGVTLLATAAAAVSTLRESPAALMLPPTPKAGKKILLEHIGPLWRNMSFLWKVTSRNILRYKKRLFMTIIGIAGCTALLLTGFGLSNSINDIIDRHYGQIIDYNIIVMKEDDFDDEDAAELAGALEEYGEVQDSAEMLDEPMVAIGGIDASGDSSSPDVGELSAQLMVPQNVDDLESIWRFRDRTTQEEVPLTDGGAVITEKLAIKYGIAPGDSIELAVQDDMGNATNDTYSIPVAGIIENYIGHRVFLTNGLYEDIFDKEPVYNSVYLESGAHEGEERDELTSAVREIDGVKTIGFNDETINQYKTALQSVDMVVVILIVAAALLAFIVLYNLTNINITERMREIATLKVLGFTEAEVDSYIFREIVILSIVGSMIGLALGILLENFVVTTAEVDAVMFGRDIHASSYLLAFALTMLFTVIVALTMRSKLRRIDMVESLKSNE